MNRFSTRRQFLSNAGLAGLGIAAASGFSLPGYAQSSGRTARATLGLVTQRPEFNRRLFGACDITGARERRAPREPG